MSQFMSMFDPPTPEQKAKMERARQKGDDVMRTIYRWVEELDLESIENFHRLLSLISNHGEEAASLARWWAGFVAMRRQQLTSWTPVEWDNVDDVEDILLGAPPAEARGEAPAVPEPTVTNAEPIEVDVDFPGSAQQEHVQQFMREALRRFVREQFNVGMSFDDEDGD